MADQPENKSIFDAPVVTPTEAPNNNAAPSQPNPLEDLLKDIVNEKGEQKYKTVQDALYGLKHAQEYIPQIKDKASSAEAEKQALLDKLAQLEDTVLELTSNRNKQPTTDGVQFDESTIQNLVEQTLTKKQQEALHRANQQEVIQTVVSKFGEKAEEMFYTKAKELGMSVEEINAMAARSPKAALTLLGISGAGAHRQPIPTPNRGSVNSENFHSPPSSFIGREEIRTTIGATSQDIQDAVGRATKMVEELKEQGLDTSFLENPKNYFKYFK